MEWKLETQEQSRPRGVDLETFLGGMETEIGGMGAYRSHSLETFLGGMETGVRRGV